MSQLLLDSDLLFEARLVAELIKALAGDNFAGVVNVQVGPICQLASSKCTGTNRSAELVRPYLVGTKDFRPQLRLSSANRPVFFRGEFTMQTPLGSAG